MTTIFIIIILTLLTALVITLAACGRRMRLLDESFRDLQTTNRALRKANAKLREINAELQELLRKEEQCVDANKDS